MGELRGKVTLVTFFATWCMPCMLEVPVLNALEHELSPRGFEVVAIGMDLEGAKVLDPFVRGAQPSYRVLLADDAIRRGRSPFGEVRQIPTTFLLDREGRIVLAYAGVVAREILRERILRLL
jgi:thiol-disulfide isomerase/thioredoxin